MTTNPAHVTTAIRAVLDHIDEHQLAIPVEIHKPGHYLAHQHGTHPQSIGMDLGRITREDVARWEESLPDSEYTSEPIRSHVAPEVTYTRHVLLALLTVGVRVVIVGRTLLDDPTPVAPPPLTVVPADDPREGVDYVTRHGHKQEL